MVGYLEVPDRGRVAVSDGLLLGRVAACEIVLSDKKASRKHARIIVKGSVVEIEDLGSSNGTRLNDKPVKRRMLRHGDVVSIGTTQISYHEGPLPGAEPPAADAAADAVDFAPGEDLFGDEDDDPIVAEPEVKPEPVAKPKPAAPAKPEPVIEPEPAVEVLEFEDDDVVEVRKPAKSDPVVELAADPSTADPFSSGDPFDDEFVQTSRPLTKDATPEARRDGILQFSKIEDRKGLLGDDMRQMSGPMRIVLYAVVLAVCAGLAYLASQMVG